jgi:mono/diheme cytochrome c family protein
VGPVTAIDVSTISPARAAEGEALFKTRCSACHKIEERYIGPALSGVTKRRQPEWILNMILKPELMLKEDPVAMELLGKFLTPMANQNLTQNEAEAIYAYFREHDKSLPDTPVDAPEETAAPKEEAPKGPPGTY